MNKRKCALCERGFPLKNGVHLPSQRLGMIPTTLCAVQPRGTIKAFREHFNGEFAGGKKHKNGVYTQRVRGYGDYLYYQDREKFNVELAAALLAGWHQNK